MDNDSAYIRIMENLEENSHRAPRNGMEYSQSFIEYLKLLYNPEEARLVQHLKIPREIFPMGLNAEDYSSASQVAEASGRDKDEVKKILNDLAQRRCILGIGAAMGEPPLKALNNMAKMTKILRRSAESKGMLSIVSDILGFVRKDVKLYGLKGATDFSLYAIPHIPLLVNHHYFSLEVNPDDLEATKLYQEFFIKEGFYKRYESSDKGTSVGRAITVKKAIEHSEKILAMEEAHSIIDTAAHIQLVPCQCRVRTEKIGDRKCKDRNPVGSCIMMNMAAIGMDSMGLGVRATKEETHRYLDEMMEHGLVAHTENHGHPVYNIICLCCECCCSQTRGRIVGDNPAGLAPSNFIPQANDDCIKCGTCVKRCMFMALHIDEETEKVVVDAEKCLGCGVCTITCKPEAIKLHRFERSKIYATPQELYRKIDSENKIPGRD